ncbi:Fic family protein [Labrys neptuniae]
MGRQYEGSHPWLTFSLELRRLDSSTWVKLGEAQSKCEHLAGAALSPRDAREIHRIYLAKGALATTAIEGNTLSEKEALDRLDGKLKLPTSKEYLGVELDNVIAAANNLLRRLEEDSSTISVEEICDFNRQVLAGLSVEEGVIPGEIRRHNVTVGAYRGAPAEDVKFLLDRLTEILNEFSPPPGQEIVYSIIKAIFTHLYVAWIHPFGDGNGRTARLLEVKILLQSGVPSSASHLLSNHYNETRSEYYRQLDYASKSGGDIYPFINYAIQGFVDQIRQQIEFVRTKLHEAAWRSFIHDTFSDASKPGDLRKRDLLIEIARAPDPVMPQLNRDTPPGISRLYYKKAPRTMTRDFNSLEEGKYIVKGPGGYNANGGLIHPLLPRRKAL